MRRSGGAEGCDSTTLRSGLCLPFSTATVGSTVLDALCLLYLYYISVFDLCAVVKWAFDDGECS